MKSIALINFYFGKEIPNYMEFYLSSVSYNKSVDLFLFTNLDIKSSENNIKIINMQFDEFADIIKKNVEKELIKRNIRDTVNISNPYKIADYRPTFGLCFKEYLKGYDFWGGCDLDLVFGNIRKYIPDDVLYNYDKIYEHGHFFLIRNNEECNLAFLEDYRNSFYSVLHLKKNSFFEEVYEKPWLPHGGINSIFDKKGKLYKDRKAFCDISFKYHNLIDLKNTVNSKKIVFVFDKGTLYRVYKTKEKICYEEVFYAHFQKRKLIKKTHKIEKFCITNTAFCSVPKNEDNMFTDTKQHDYMTYKYFKFRYIDSIKRKINGEFRLKKGAK